MLFFSVVVGACSFLAAFNLVCNVVPGAICASTTASRMGHAVTALTHVAVYAVDWCRGIRR